EESNLQQEFISNDIEANVEVNEEGEVIVPNSNFYEHPQDESTNEVIKETLAIGKKLEEQNKPESIPADNQLSLNLTEEETNNQNLTLRVIDILETKEADFAFSQGLNNNSLNK